MDAIDQITPALGLGERIVVRHRLPDGSATDALGWLESIDDDRLALRDHTGSRVEVARRALVALRRLPPARGGRNPMRTTAAELQQLALHGWMADHQPLGEWTLRAGGGFTARANSCLAVGDPGVPLAEAADRIVAYAMQQGAHPWAQVIDGSLEEQGLRGLGWRDVYLATDVLVTRLADLLARTRPDQRVRVADELEPAWEEAYRVSRPHSGNPAVRAILDNGAPRAFAGVPGPDGLLAIGRGHVRADWLGVAAIWTAPGHRRQGWAGRVLLGLGHWGARRGARQVYLQVAAKNTTAHRAYERLGFAPHHRYRYLQAPEA